MRGWLVVGFIVTSCSSLPPFEPTITYLPPQSLISSLPTAFPPLDKEELQTLWGKELYLGTRFADEGDGYRAITAFKSSLFLLPKKEVERKQQLEFYLFLSYYVAGKYREACEVYENSSLVDLKEDFPAKKELFVALWECYDKTGQCEKARLIQNRQEPLLQEDLSLLKAVETGDISSLEHHRDRSAIDCLLKDYGSEMKSPSKARSLQAILPGAGYWYVGQKKSAITSFVINTLFLAAAAQFFERGYYAPALITLSLEAGWYFGGINGAGLAANEYNEHLYEGLAKETLIKERLFPILKFEVAF